MLIKVENTMRFERKPNYYLDTKTGLEWALTDLGTRCWTDAMDLYPQDKEWRLPSIQELQTLVDTKLTNPATELPGMLSAYYWSSTTNTNYTNYAWIVYFGNGYDDNNDKSNSRYVRAVRG